MEEILDKIIEEINARQCVRDIAMFWGFRSTVPGPGLRQASEFIYQRHLEHHVQAEMIPYPADDHTVWLDERKNPLTWTPRSARLQLTKPSQKAYTICDYAEEPLCLISNSTSTPPGGVTAEVVVIHDATQESAYEDLNVHGKIVFTDIWPLLADEQARSHGAIGILTDSVCPPWLKHYPPMREPADVPDLTMWGVLSGGRNEKSLWGFSLSPRQGWRLRQVLSESQEPVVLHADVDAELAEGTSELVTAVLPGSDLVEEEIWVLSHSSEPGALDDAAGCCLSIEIARTLTALIESGKLAPPRRTIRFLTAVEGDGYMPYVHGRLSELERVKASLSLDSIGHDFRVCGGRLEILRSPEFNPSFADSILEYLATVTGEKPNSLFTDDNYDPFFWEVKPNFPGNDNFLGEGFFDIPTAMLCDWPDKYYHSNLDRVENVSENSLARTGAVAAAFLYFLATASTAQAAQIAELVRRDWQRRIGKELERASNELTILSSVEQTSHIRNLARHLAYKGIDAIQTIRRLAPEDNKLAKILNRFSSEIWDFAQLETEASVQVNLMLQGQKIVSVESPTVESTTSLPKDVIYKPLSWHVPPDERFSITGKEKLERLRQQYKGIDEAWKWLNGRRSVVEVWERLQFSEAFPADGLVAYLDLLVAEGMILPIKLI